MISGCFEEEGSQQLRKWKAPAHLPTGWEGCAGGSEAAKILHPLRDLRALMNRPQLQPTGLR